MRVSDSGSRPIPLSATDSRAWRPSRRRETRMRPFSGVYLAALSRRFETIWTRRTSSPSSSSGSGLCSTLSSWRRSSIAQPILPIAALTMFAQIDPLCFQLHPA